MKYGSRFSTLLVGCVLLLSAATALAVQPLASSLTGDAEGAYESGRLLFDDGDSVGALTKFRLAFDLSHDPRLLWNMAVCEKELRHYGRAAALIERYLADGGKRLTTEQRQNATETAKALRAFYSTVNLSGAPTGATVIVDNDVAGTVPLSEPLLLDLGVRALRVELKGFEPFQKNIDVPGSGTVDVQVVLKRFVTGSKEPRLSVTTSGDADTVIVDGKVVGSHQWQGTLSAGEHTVRVTAAGKEPYESEVELQAGATRTLHVTLEDESQGSSPWPWIAGGTLLAAGAVVGGYFLFKPNDDPGGHPSGSLSTVFLPEGFRSVGAWR